MAEKPNGGPKTIPGTNLPRHEPSEFDRLAGENLHKAVIGNPSGESGVTVGAAPPTPSAVELPGSISAAQAALIQAAVAAAMKGIAPQNVNPVPPQARDFIVPDNNTRMWNPNQPFQPTARLSDMERTVGNANANPMSVIPNAPVSVKLVPKVDCPQIMIDIYILLNNLLENGWILQTCPQRVEVRDTLSRLKTIIEGN